MENNNTDVTVSEILASFRMFDGKYKREQIDAARNLKEEITPHLIEILEKVLSDPEKYAADDDLYDHIYALMLLGHFKEPKAHKVIYNLFILKDDLPYRMFGDIFTSNLPVILLNTCGGSLDLIRSMVLNRDADDYSKVSACHALAYCVIEGYAYRESVIEFFGQLFTGNEADEGSDFWGLLASIACDLYPEEIMDTIRQAYEDGLIMPGMVRYADFEKSLAFGEEKCLELLKRRLDQDSLGDIHGAMSWWACFNEDPEPSLPESSIDNYSFPGATGQPSVESDRKKKATRKKKRKQTKASRKKNRRK